MEIKAVKIIIRTTNGLMNVFELSMPQGERSGIMSEARIINIQNVCVRLR